MQRTPWLPRCYDTAADGRVRQIDPVSTPQQELSSIRKKGTQLCQITLIVTPTPAEWLGTHAELVERLPNVHAVTVPLPVISNCDYWSHWLDSTVQPLQQQLAAWLQGDPTRSGSLHVVTYSVAGLLVTSWTPPITFGSYSLTLIDPSSKSTLWHRFALSNRCSISEAILSQWDAIPEMQAFESQSTRLSSVEWHMPRPLARWFLAANGENPGEASSRGTGGEHGGASSRGTRGKHGGASSRGTRGEHGGASSRGTGGEHGEASSRGTGGEHGGHCVSDGAMEALWEAHREWIEARTTRLVVLGKRVNHSTAWRVWLSQQKKLRNK